MKIWIDFINTPQVSFWVPFIKDFEKDGHEFVFTCRDSANTVALLKINNLKFTIIGNGVGKGKFQKSLLFPLRIIKLFFFIRSRKPDISASQSSFYLPLVSWLLNIPCLYTNDNEHAKGNWFGFKFAKKVILPVTLQNEAFTLKEPLKSKLTFYPGVKESIYLSQLNIHLSVNGNHNVVYFRPEPWSAEYYKGPLNFFDETLLTLSSVFKVVILPRDKNQVKHYKQLKFSNITIAEKPLSLYEIISDCKLFIGAGGSMTRELAILGIPVISIYQDEILKVDRYLIEKGCMTVNPKITYEEIHEFLIKSQSEIKKLSVLEEGLESYKKIKKLINNLKN